MCHSSGYAWAQLFVSGCENKSDQISVADVTVVVAASRQAGTLYACGQMSVVETVYICEYGYVTRCL